ncbi:hypothetical protein CXB51_034162 [Gossypium anomalum]|uniref:Uncharacterized protein n=1 Tax=Gossypium anomalum TaxID=47600 RepID=A0A8J5XQ88_9ROSI|nr:hypothetical protein CXB51_034162 [Gossypium anomalum]
MCIRVIGASNRRYAHTDDVICCDLGSSTKYPLERLEVIKVDCTRKSKGHLNFWCDLLGSKTIDFIKVVSLTPEFTKAKDTIADIITSIRNTDMNRKGTIQIGSTNTIENIVKMLLRGHIDNWDGDCNSFYFSSYNDKLGGSTRRNWWRNCVIYGEFYQRRIKSTKVDGKCYLSSGRPRYAMSRSYDKDATFRAIHRSGILLSFVRDCVESRAKSKCLYYGCFILSSLMKAQANAKGHCDAKSFAWGTRRNMHYTSCIERELYGTHNAFIFVKGLGYVTAQDIILSPSVKIVDNTQYIASPIELIDLCIRL